MMATDLFADPAAIALGRIEAVPLAAEHFFALEPQDSQATQYGLDPREMEWAEAEAVAANPGCYAVLRGLEVLACLGVSQTFPGAQGVAFGFLGKNIGRAHHALTRFARDVVIGQSPLARIEAIVRCADIPQSVLSPDGCLRTEAEAPPGQLPMMTHALQHATPQVRWALAVGLWPACVLRKFGAASETHMLLERIL
jgi:hypothetical protein